MLIEITAPNAQLVNSDFAPPAEPITRLSLTLLMAYIHNYTPKRLADCRLIGANHIRRIAQLINFAGENKPSIRQNKPVASHLALLQAARFLETTGHYLVLQPTVTNWLHATSEAQLKKLLTLLANTNIWSATLASMGLQDTITIDYTHFLQQSLQRQQKATVTNEAETTELPAIWQETEHQNIWRLSLPKNLPLWLHFDIRQLGDWTQIDSLTCTPLTIATSVQRGYGLDTIQWLLEIATQKPLPEEKAIQLRQWCRRTKTYQLRAVHLLSTTHEEKMAELLRNKQLRHRVIEQIAPRHAVVSPDFIPYLNTYLTKQQYPKINRHPLPAPVETAPGISWLANRILIDLGQFVPLPFSPPNGFLEHLENQLEDTQKSSLEAIASIFIKNLHDAIRGRDTFLPAQCPPSSATLQIIRSAIAKEQTLNINYKAISESKPSQRRIQPLHLEQRGNLYYLHAYCYRSEMNLTFRLDRIKR